MSRRRPNVVLILADDMGYGDFSAFNRGISTTPVLDALIQEGVCLTQQYTASPVCNPSRACLLTGRYPHRTGSIDTLEWRGLERLALRETTLADVFQQAGYATGLIGKWHLGAYDERYHPNQRGFDESVCFRGGMHDYFNWRLEYDSDVKRADGRYLTDVFTDEAVQYIDRHKQEPFFLHVTYNAPHTPLEAPEHLVKKFRDPDKFTHGVSILYAMIKRMDEGIGRILEALRKNGLEKDTIFLFTSDNGPALGGQGEHCLKRFNCNFNGAKGSVYEGGIRVPMILRWPSGIPQSRTIHEMVHFSDWFPTLLSAADLKPPSRIKLDGKDLLAVLRGEAGSSQPPRFWQWNRYTPLVESNAAVRDGDWKLIRPTLSAAMGVPDIHWLWVSMYGPDYFINHGLVKDPEPERDIKDIPDPKLYNLAEDPEEKVNLADQHPDQARKMLLNLENWFEEVERERATIGDEW